MSTRNKTLLGLITAGLLTAGVAWAADVPGTTISDRTVVPVEGSGRVTLELVTEGLAIVEAIPDEGWTVTVERSIGSEVEAHFDSAGNRVDFNAELQAGGEIEVEIERFVAGSSTSSTTLITSTSVTVPSTSSTIDVPVSTTIDGDGSSTSTTVDDSSTSTTVDDSSTSTTIDDNDASTSTTIDDNDETTSTTIDNDIIDLPDGPRTFTVGAAGTVVVNVEAGRLALATVTAGLGWSFEVEKAESDDIRVEFESQLDAEAEIRVRINDGRLEVKIENN